MTEKESAQVVVRCHLRRRVTTTDNNDSKTTDEDLRTNDHPMELVIQGAFWDKPLSEVIPSGQPNPLEWRWSFTARSPSKRQLIQITLPPFDADQAQNTQREVTNSGRNESANSRYITVSVRVCQGLGFRTGLHRVYRLWDGFSGEDCLGHGWQTLSAG